LQEFCSLKCLLGTCFSGTDPGEYRQGLRPMRGLLPVCLWRLDQAAPSARVTQYVGPVQSTAGTAATSAQRCLATIFLLFNCYLLSTNTSHVALEMPVKPIAHGVVPLDNCCTAHCCVSWMRSACASGSRNSGPSTADGDLVAVCHGFAWSRYDGSLSLCCVSSTGPRNRVKGLPQFEL
jgi:hypothetical protein